MPAVHIQTWPGGDTCWENTRFRLPCGAGSTETLAFALAMVFDLQVGRLLSQPSGWNGVLSTLLTFSVGAAVLVAVFMQQEKRLEDKMLAS